MKPGSSSEEDDNDPESSSGEPEESEDDSTTTDDEYDETGEWNNEDMRLPHVLKAFTYLKGDFDRKFKKMWA